MAEISYGFELFRSDNCWTGGSDPFGLRDRFYGKDGVGDLFSGKVFDGIQLSSDREVGVSRFDIESSWDDTVWLLCIIAECSLSEVVDIDLNGLLSTCAAENWDAAITAAANELGIDNPPEFKWMLTGEFYNG